MLDNVNKTLNDISKNLEKTAIQDIVANLCHSASLNKHKNVVKQAKKCSDDLKFITKSYNDDFKSKASGTWVKETVSVLNEVSEQLDKK